MSSVLIYKALSDRNRQRILKALEVRMLCSCEITELLGLANSTVNQHMNLLKEASLITEARDGRWVNYFLNRESVNPRIKELTGNLDFWIEWGEDTQSDRKKLETLDRKILCKI